MAKRTSTRSTRTSGKKTTAKKTSGRSFKIALHTPGATPKSILVKPGTTVGEVAEEYNVKGYTLYHNGSKAELANVLSKGDTIRVGVVTKGAVA